MLSRALYGADFNQVSLASNDRQVGIADASFSQLDSAIRKIALKSVQPSTGYVLAKTVSEVQPCDGGGTAKLSGTVDDVTYLGTLTVSFDKCSSANSTLSGTAQMRVTGFNTSSNQLTAFELVYNQLTLVFNGVSYTVLGNQLYSASANNEKVISTMLRKNSITNKQSLIKNYTNDAKISSTSGVRYEHLLSGQVFLESYGYSTLSTIEPIEYYTYEYPVRGQAILKGLSNSKLRLTGSDYGVLAELDSDGDNIYELYKLVTLENLNSSDAFTQNKAPEIHLSHSGGVNGEVFVGDTVYLYAYSTDEDGDSVTHKWLLDKKPVGSKAIILNSTAESASIIIDTAGSYTIGLIATDSKGKSVKSSLTLETFCYPVCD
ncbi:MAG: hypothetical protein WAQ53_07380 [Thiofilum sp.]|uniref:hypothetical protein n=1 Tax=Thiofilum sp. TaxID=2212733 RepID=UPI0025E3C79D|nr:hypothetical protein [Thiofilum sp.]MBK8455113.1 hypothetical protein [Thiofilum sp.]